MLNKNTKIAIIAVVCIILIVVIWKVSSNKKDAEPNTTESKVSYTQDNTTGEYIIYDENGQEKTRVKDEAEIKIYEDNPDYDPKLPGSTSEYDESMINSEVYQ